MSDSRDDGAFRPADALNKLHTVDDARTTAKRLAAYRDGLLAGGFAEDEAHDLVRIAAQRLEDIVVPADLADEPTAVGEVIVRFEPRIDADEIERVVKQAHATVTKAANR